jgi:MAP/microtubule affinity-regulating kinase
MPKIVGRGAELVLRGCLEASVTQRWTIAAVDDVSWSVGWDSDIDDLCSGPAESELERMVHERHAHAKIPASYPIACAPSVAPEHDVASDDAVPDLEYDAEPARDRFARSISSRSRSTGPGSFSPFTNVWSEIEMPSVGPPELTLPGTFTRPSRERSRGRHAIKDSVSGRRQSSLGPARSASPIVTPISPASAEMRGRKGNAAPSAPPPPTLGLGLSTGGPKRAGSQPPRVSAPWAVPSRAHPSVGVSPALSVALSTPHADGGYVLKTGIAGTRSRSVGYARPSLNVL